MRVKFRDILAKAQIPIQIDIGFGDAVCPKPKFAAFPVLLPMGTPVILAYPREAAIAKKFHAMVALDIRNSRMKDFYDIWFMACTWTFEMAGLRGAIIASFQIRGTAQPENVPLALTAEFLDDPQKMQQWNAFISRLGSRDRAASFKEVGELLCQFLAPCLDSSPSPDFSARSWMPSLGWSTTKPE